jgi:2-C-methyl-D-erythritol 4-phosphate cytidylyltransferase
MKIYVIIPAGGKGLRSGSATPKQYRKFKGKELIVYTLETFQKNKLISEIIISAEPAYFGLLTKLKKKYKLTKLKTIVKGGKKRQDSVYNGLKSLDAKKNDLIIVHDAARPLLPGDILTNAIKTATTKGNALVCVKAGDTIIKGTNTVEEYIDRNNVRYVQTPQIFRYFDLKMAMQKAFDDNFYGTDESVLIKRIGKSINIVEGSFLNFKITTKADFKVLKKLI